MYSRTLGEKNEHQTKSAQNKLNTINCVKKKNVVSTRQKIVHHVISCRKVSGVSVPILKMMNMKKFVSRVA
jgi:hypothetical protein